MVRIFRALAASWTAHAPPEHDLVNQNAMAGLDAMSMARMSLGLGR